MESSPIATIDQRHSPVLLVQADDDDVVPSQQAAELIEGLRSHNIDHDVIMIPNEIHDLARYDDRIVRRWYDYRENNEVVEFSVSHQNIGEYTRHLRARATQVRRTGGLHTERAIKRGEQRMTKAIALSMLSLIHI